MEKWDRNTILNNDKIFSKLHVKHKLLYPRSLVYKYQFFTITTISHTHRHSTEKLLNTKDDEKMLKNKTMTNRVIWIYIRKIKDNKSCLRCWKEKQKLILYPGKISFKNKDETKAFSPTWQLRGFVPIDLYLRCIYSDYVYMCICVFVYTYVCIVYICIYVNILTLHWTHLPSTSLSKVLLQHLLWFFKIISKYTVMCLCMLFNLNVQLGAVS